jgi:hypothetical protein
MRKEVGNSQHYYFRDEAVFFQIVREFSNHVETDTP